MAVSRLRPYRPLTIAAFYAADAALPELGETRSKHSAVVAALIRLVVDEGDLDPHAGRLLRSLFDRRALADYSTRSVPPEEADAAVGDAARVVMAVDRWIDVRGE